MKLASMLYGHGNNGLYGVLYEERLLCSLVWRLHASSFKSWKVI